MEYRDRDLLNQQSQSPLGGVDSGTKSDTKQHRKRECADGRKEQECVLSLFRTPVRTGAAESQHEVALP